MIKRPLSPRFARAVLDGVKTTTIRDRFWPRDVPIMLFHWAGRPYRSAHVDVAPIIVLGVRPINITHRDDGGMEYNMARRATTAPLHATEGFASRDDLDAWFRPLVPPGMTVTKTLMRFRLL